MRWAAWDGARGSHLGRQTVQCLTLRGEAGCTPGIAGWRGRGVGGGVRAGSGCVEPGLKGLGFGHGPQCALAQCGLNQRSANLLLGVPSVCLAG
ncbi:hypothetical protein E2C01_090715 [Portunus trituberculatus]|uniref:Uncharacterized protein n=1 Tax=Portunus trituberculatus TaxID=210409 RepID=A0A5B7JL28_PORTR|nr:hypothetical protein [Portunus trituberculatus]